MRVSEPPPLLPYFARTPVSRSGKELVRLVRDGDVATVAVFPWGAASSELIGSLLLFGFAAAFGVKILVEPTGHTAALLAKAWVVLCFAFVALFGGVFAAAAVVNAFRQAEFDVTPGDLTVVSFGPFAAAPRRWPRDEVTGLRVEPQRHRQIARLVLLTRGGPEAELLRGRAVAAREAERLLRELLALPPGEPPPSRS